MKGITIEGNGATLMFHGKIDYDRIRSLSTDKIKESKI